jgi:hypothetical protein
MKLGLLGPAEDDLDGLARAAEFLVNGAKAEKVIYLGNDLALEDIVEAWAESLVGGDPSDRGIWDRAFDVARSGTPAEIDVFLKAERGRLRLRALQSLPRDTLRTVEMFGDRVAVLCHDKGLLDEEDIFSATLLVFGKSDAPLAKKIGTRWFLTPGRIGSPGGGVIVLDDDGEEMTATIYDSGGKASHCESLSSARSATFRVTGDS